MEPKKEDYVERGDILLKYPQKFTNVASKCTGARDLRMILPFRIKISVITNDKITKHDIIPNQSTQIYEQANIHTINACQYLIYQRQRRKH